jgi:polyphosphate kinase
VPGVSERIRVTSVIDRYLEHHRIWFFEAAGKREVWLASADWMARNFVRRVEIAFPVQDPAVKERIVDEILATSLADNVKARALQADGSYVRVQPGAFGTSLTPLRSQERFMAIARRVAVAAVEPATTSSSMAPHEMFPTVAQRRERKKRKRL